MKMKSVSILFLSFCCAVFATNINSQIDSTHYTPYEKWADMLVNYSLNLQPGETLLIETTPLSQELCLLVYEEAIKAGAHPYLSIELPGAKEIFMGTATDTQLMYVTPVYKFMYENFDANVSINAPANTRSLSSIDPTRIQMKNKAFMEKAKSILYSRIDSSQLKWCYTSFPTPALAQEAEMGIEEYKKFVFESCQLFESDPKKSWEQLSQKQEELCEWLNGKSDILLRGPNIDLRMSIKDRPFFNEDGKQNFPGGEIYTSPVENSTNGWIRFSYPAIFESQEIIDVELWFENGKVIKEKASKGQAFLTETLNTDAGSRFVGELGIGTNYGIKRFTKFMLFDEKMGGTIHIAVGHGFPEVGGTNVSAIHWDMLCDMSEGEILVDGEVFYKNGKYVKY
ncbi:aminopeptidase [Acidobacteriota bacterium]